MKTAIASIHNVENSPYSQAGFLASERKQNETPGEFEKRAWRERMHTTDNGQIFIPPMAFKWSLDGAAALLGKRVPGRGQKQYRSIFQSGVLVTEGLVLPIKAEDVPGEWLWMNADGRRGSGTRVQRCYGRIDKWSGKVAFHILNDAITEEVFEEHLIAAGKFVGIGRFRPANGGYYGRFLVDEVQWVDEALQTAAE